MKDTFLVHFVKVLLFLYAALSAVSPAAAQAQWWKLRWPYRCRLTVQNYRKATGYAGDDVGVATFRTGGLAGKRGGDIRVIASDLTVCPTRILAMGPGDTVQIAFGLRPGKDTYFAYFGNSEAAEDGSPRLAVRRGVLLEMWKYAGGNANNLDDAQKTLERAMKKGGMIGRGMRTRIYLGYNPFGPESSIVSRYTGFLDCPADGEYLFSITSNHASFLVIDEKLVVKKPGWHGAVRQSKFRGTLRIEKGVHTLVCYHVNKHHDPRVVVAWRPPGEEKIRVIPGGAFLPFFSGTAGAIEKKGGVVDIDFFVTHAGEAFLKNRYHQRYIFKAVQTGTVPREMKWHWDFGDGISSKASENEIDHVYLEDGTYTVTLKGSYGRKSFERIHVLHVERPWDRRTAKDIEQVTLYASIVLNYDVSNMSSGANAEAVLLFHRAGMKKDVLRAAQAFLAREKAPAKQLNLVMPACTEVLFAYKKPAGAAQALLRASEMTRDVGASSAFMLQAADILLDEQDNVTKAEEIYQKVHKQADGLKKRAAVIGLGDVHLARGEYQKAGKRYAAAGRRGKQAVENPAIARGDFAHKIVDYVRRGEMEAAAEMVRAWEEAMPGDKLTGYLALLDARRLYAMEQYRCALLKAQRLVGVNPESQYAPELLILASKAHVKLGQKDRAVECLKRILEEYAESPCSVEASRLLKNG